jgi:glycosyltransferase involved in cell wall biosynthesis
MILIRYLLASIQLHVKNPRVTLLTSDEAATHPNCQKLLGDFSHLVSLRIAPPVTRRSRLFGALGAFYERQWVQAVSLEQGLDELGANSVDFVLLPHLESVGLLQIGLRPNLFRGRPWATIAVAIRFHLRRCGIEGSFRWLDFLQKLFFWHIIRRPSLVCFGSVNPYFARAIDHPKVVHCPDPAPPPVLSSVEAARAAYGIRPETCVVLVFGFIDRRKCLDALFEGVARVIPDLDLTVFLAGTQHREHLAPVMNGAAARKLREHGRLVEANRFIMDGVDIDPMSAADIVWVFYERDFVIQGSVLVRCGLARRPAITRDTGTIGRQVAEFKCGLALSSDSADEVAAALTRLARDPAMRAEMGDNGARGFAGHTPENFARPIVDAINRAVVTD